MTGSDRYGSGSLQTDVGETANQSVDGTERCKRCDEPIDDETVILLHGRFPMHGDCYEAVVGL